jgi:hypothetical protein
VRHPKRRRRCRRGGAADHELIAAVLGEDEAVEVEDDAEPDAATSGQRFADLVRQGLDSGVCARQLGAVGGLEDDVDAVVVFALVSRDEDPNSEHESRVAGGDRGGIDGVEAGSVDVELAVLARCDAVGEHGEVEIHSQRRLSDRQDGMGQSQASQSPTGPDRAGSDRSMVANMMPATRMFSALRRAFRMVVGALRIPVAVPLKALQTAGFSFEWSPCGPVDGPAALVGCTLVLLATATPAGALPRAAWHPSGWEGVVPPPVLEPLPTGVQVIPTACPYSPAKGCSDGTRIWSDPTGDPGLAAFRVRHEMGHVQDHRFYDPGERNRLTRLMGFPVGTPWSQGTWPRIDRSPEEVAADAFASCSLGLMPNGSYWVMTAYNWDPTPLQQRLVCGTIRRAIAPDVGPRRAVLPFPGRHTPGVHGAGDPAQGAP